MDSRSASIPPTIRPYRAAAIERVPLEWEAPARGCAWQRTPLVCRRSAQNAGSALGDGLLRLPVCGRSEPQRSGREGLEPMLELDEDQRFAEPVALSSTQPADRPLSRRALRPSLDLVTLRARRTEKPKRWSCDGQAALRNVGARPSSRVRDAATQYAPVCSDGPANTRPMRRQPEYLATLGEEHSATPWLEAGRAAATGDFRRAAAGYEEIGARAAASA